MDERDVGGGGWDAGGGGWVVGAERPEPASSLIN